MYRLTVLAVIAMTLSIAGGIGLARDGESVAEAPTITSAPLGLDAANPTDLGSYVTSLQVRLRQVPDDEGSWANLGLAYVEQARVTGNPTLYVHAERAIDRSLEVRADDNAAAFAAAAALEAARHDFDASLSSADEALRINPFQPGALAVRVDALTELGRYEQQLKALQTADRRQPGIPVAARYAYALELRGKLAEASEILDRAAATAGPADRAYLFTLLADLERRRGLLDRSGRHVREAMRLGPELLAARASSARLAVARGRFDDAARQWEQVVETLPLPEYLTELGELYDFLGRGDEAQQQYDVVVATTALFTRSGVNTDLELALFSADHGDPASALPGAHAEWNRRKSVHVADVLAWTLHQTGNDSRALPLARAATRLGTAESRLWLHRGAIEAGLGMNAEARKHLRRGLATDPGTSPWQVEQAQSLLADLGSGR